MSPRKSLFLRHYFHIQQCSFDQKRKQQRPIFQYQYPQNSDRLSYKYLEILRSFAIVNRRTKVAYATIQTSREKGLEYLDPDGW